MAIVIFVRWWLVVHWLSFVFGLLWSVWEFSVFLSHYMSRHFLLLLLLVWHAPLGVRSAKRRHPSPEWTIPSHSHRLIQWEIAWSQVLLDSLHPRGSRTSWWFPPVLRRGSSYDTPGNTTQAVKPQCTSPYKTTQMLTWVLNQLLE